MFKNNKYNFHPELIVDEPVEIRLAHAKDKDSSPELLKVLMKDKFWYVRYFVASNPSAPKECLNVLCHDGDFRVRDSAKSTLSKYGSFDKPTLNDTLRAAKDIAQSKSVNNKLVFNKTSKDRDI